jgi:hypothetical protein
LGIYILDARICLQVLDVLRNPCTCQLNLFFEFLQNFFFRARNTAL